MALTKQQKELKEAGVMARGDSLRVLHSAIKHEPGFNVDGRLDDCEENRALEQYLFDGGMIPDIEVRFADDGSVYIVEGHRRHHFYGKAMERGAPLDPFMTVKPFKGNDADRIARIATSNSQLAVTPLQLSDVYMRLSRMGHNPAAIAKMVGKSSVHVSNTLKLAYANSDLRRMVKSGQVSATRAIAAQKQHGEKAAQKVLEPKLSRAEKIDVLAEVMAIVDACEGVKSLPAAKSELGKRLVGLLERLP